MGCHIYTGNRSRASLAIVSASLGLCISYTTTVLVWAAQYRKSQCILNVRGAWMRLHRRLVQNVGFIYKRVVGGRSWLFDQEGTHTKCGSIHNTVAAHGTVTQMIVVVVVVVRFSVRNPTFGGQSRT